MIEITGCIKEMDRMDERKLKVLCSEAMGGGEAFSYQDQKSM